MAKKDEILFEWTVPHRITRNEADRQLKRGKKLAPRFIIITVISVILLYLFFKDFPLPPDQSWEKTFLLIFSLVIGTILILCYIFPWLTRGSKHVYQITRKGIFYKGEQGRHLWPWGKIRGYSIDRDEETNSSVLTLILETYHRKVYLADEEESVANVINLIGDKVSYIEKEELGMIRVDKLTRRDDLILVIISTVYIIFYTWFLLSYRPTGIMRIFFVILALCLGPGTIGFFALFRKRMFKKIHLCEWMQSR